MVFSCNENHSTVSPPASDDASSSQMVHDKYEHTQLQAFDNCVAMFVAILVRGRIRFRRY